MAPASCWRGNRSVAQAEVGIVMGTGPSPVAKQNRLAGLDVLRGLAIFGILVVNALPDLLAAVAAAAMKV